MKKLAIIGDGKMGRAIAELAPGQGFEVAAVLGRTAVSRGLTRDLLGGADVAIEFTEASAAPENLRGCFAARIPVVSGTTGWDSQRRDVEGEARRSGGALLWAPNFSIGVHVFTKIVAEAARAAAAAGIFDAQLVETHHAAKKDAPSGTARHLREAAGVLADLPITSIRTGHVPGEHVLILDAPFEQIRLEHVARDRRVFADGALRAASWIVGKQGVFTLDDVLNSGT